MRRAGMGKNTRLCVLRGLALGLCVGLLGCPSAGKQETAATAAPALAAPGWSIRSFSETVPYTSVTVFDGKIYVGTPRGLIRFDDQTGEHLRITRRQGLAGDKVQALAEHPRSGLWVATEGGISRLRDGTWTNFSLGKSHGDRVTAMVATSWGVWVGGPRGLEQFKDGRWKGMLPGARVNCLLADMAGDGVWVGTDGEGIHHGDGSGHMDNHAASRGQPLRNVRGLSYTQNAGVIAVGRGDEGDGLAFFDGTHWTAYYPRPAGRLHWVQLAAMELLLAYEDHILRLRQVNDPAAALPAGPVTLERRLSSEVPPSYPAPRFYTERHEQWLPLHPTVVVGQGADVLIATRTAGLVRYDGKFTRWYRTGDLTGGAERLGVACSPDGSCFMAGRERAYRFDGDAGSGRFVEVDGVAGEGARVDLFLKGPSGGVLAIVSPAEGSKLLLRRLDQGKWVPQRDYAVAIPAGRPRATFARPGPDGRLWVGLSYEDENGEHAWGMVVLGSDGSTLFHRSTLQPEEKRPPGSLALPDDIRDVQFPGDGAIWVATTTGVCRVKGTDVQLFTENDGLASEIVHAVTRTPGGRLLVGTHGGLGRFDGKDWYFDFPGALQTPTRALLLEGNHLWVGTARGLLRLAADDLKVQLSLSGREGLADERIMDLQRDPRGRLWVLAQTGLSLVSRSK